ncbi:MAG: DUF6760 family protein [Cyanobacteria bacterium P01_D01_bin.115]
MSASVCSGAVAIGGALGYPSQRLQEEVAAIAYHFHWSLSDILAFDHISRQHWVEATQRFSRDRRS